LILSRLQAIDDRMSTMLVEVYDALKEAGASEEKARAAATSLADPRWHEVDQRFDEIDQRFQRVDQRFDEVDRRFRHVEQRLDRVEGRLGLVEQALEAVTKRLGTLEEKVVSIAQDVAVIKAEFGLMKWMNGITIGGVLALLVKAFFG
jgi:chromosome segregation ATPase